MEIYDEEGERDEPQSRMIPGGYAGYRNEPPAVPSRNRQDYDYYDDREAMGREQSAPRRNNTNPYPNRPTTANRRYGVDSSYYLDDPNYD